MKTNTLLTHGATVGNLLFKRADAAASPEEKNAFWDDAQKKYRRATDENEHHAAAWCNWGNLLSARAKAASSPRREERLLGRRSEEIQARY